MSNLRVRHLLICLMATLVGADDIDFGIEESLLVKALRDASNQNKTDTLNLPANASSIRENITDTFSCENKTYGYYADVDNDCQLFHVCLPSQTPSGRNVTYRWSFICPNETIFNQEVLTCTRVADSIACEDSPMFYHLNMEIGKVSNKTEEKEKTNRKTQKRKTNDKREKIMMEKFINKVEDGMKEKLQEIEKPGDDSPMLLEAVIESVEGEMDTDDQEEDLDRIIMERNMRQERQMREETQERQERQQRQLRRGNVRFRGDI
ncbi:unnamed protein product [Chrysodeixis includens]|uniref:Chitin-binding type-2 domain-containing protein n=1 Tax=Chrysodeixis includens TaxID=689277 RepID=A0A9P0FYQ2_CHRIL|nr:unnamed protein product [Chrysodeixis includens]